jgi:competence protein ComEA
MQSTWGLIFQSYVLNLFGLTIFNCYFFASMTHRFFYWMKSYLGFSRKESRGFLLFLPFLGIFAISPYLIQAYKGYNSNWINEKYLNKLDSLEKAGFVLERSPLPVFNPSDTIKTKSKGEVKENLNRMPFSEADSVVLQIIPGIGPSLAGRIIKYRENLGGYYEKSQLLDIYNLKPETIALIWEYFDFDPKVFRKIQINSLSVNELAAHPYISYAEAKVLVAFRNQHGTYSSREDLLRIKIFKEEWVDKLSPYLEF